MSSQLNVDTIVDKAGSGGTNVKIGNTSTYVSDGGSATQNTVQSLVKSWSAFDGRSTPSFYDSFNIASLTDNNTGDYRLVFTNGFSTKNYCTVLSHEHTVSNSGCDATPSQSDGTTTTAGLRILCIEDDAQRDPVFFNTLIAGDLA